MPETDTTEAAEVDHEGSTGERLNAVENGLNRLADMVARLVPASHADAEQREESRLDRASTIEEQVAAELDKRDRQAREAADAETRANAERTERETTAARLARLEEKPPAPPRLRRTKALGWGDGRT